MVNPSLFAKVPYDPVKDFAPISIVAVSPNVMTVHPSVPAKTVQELIALIKANPGKYSFAAPGVGSTPHLSGEIFRLSQGIDMVDRAVHRRRPRHPEHGRRPHADRLHGHAAGRSADQGRHCCVRWW